jgi:hypothetical protein
MKPSDPLIFQTMEPPLMSSHAVLMALPMESKFAGTTLGWSGIFPDGVGTSEQKSEYAIMSSP